MVSIARYVATIATLAAVAVHTSRAESEDGLEVSDRQRFETALSSLDGRIQTLRRARSAADRDLFADAEVFAKGVRWALRYDTSFAASDRKLLESALSRYERRVTALEAGSSPWTTRTGRVVRGFVSTIDGSVQPYAMVIPPEYDGKTPVRLDVVLHGSSRPVGMSELQFMGRFDEASRPDASEKDRGFIELHPLGRVENGYRWAGETDVFEAIEAACRNYRIDRRRIVLRGMSMGASGTWHLGLKHPDRFVALGPYCGYVDTHEFSKTPLPNFVKVDTLPDAQERMLHMLDSVDYAANAAMVAAIACIGDKDVFFQAHEIMRRAMEREGLTMVNLISHGTGHVIDPATQQEQMRRIALVAAKGVDDSPRHVRFVTWTLKYSRCHWLQVLGLEAHYARAEIEGWDRGSGAVEIREPRNVTRFAVLPPVASTMKTIRIGHATLTVPVSLKGAERTGVVLGRRDGKWACLGELDGVALSGKRPGLQGPIDDAFTGPFLCVRGTGSPWSPAVQRWSSASLERFSHEWSRYFRGKLPIKDDTALTEEDARRYHLALFGDPGSNRWIARVLPHLPVRWTRDELAIGGVHLTSSDHAPMFIQPNPLGPGRYVVVNSGHTFHEQELSTLNYLLYPRLGDWGISRLDVSPRDPDTAVVHRGLFDENWLPLRTSR